MRGAKTGATASLAGGEADSEEVPEGADLSDAARDDRREGWEGDMGVASQSFDATGAVLRSARSRERPRE